MTGKVLRALACLMAIVVSDAGAEPVQGAPASQPVVISGVLPDQASRALIVNRLKSVYGNDRVQEQIQSGSVEASQQWLAALQKAIGPSLAQVTHGSLSVRGQAVELHGEVGSESVRQQVIADLTQAFGPSFSIRNDLRVSAQEQNILDQTLANRIVEFEPGSAVLRPESRPLLDEMAQVMMRFKERRFEVIGHTDSQGGRSANVALSIARAQAVKTYLVSKGLPSDRLSTSGLGPDRPVASNESDAGRARNRRIEFRVGS